MAIYLPETTASTTESLTPRQIVLELDKHVIGQAQAKRAVAIALRNRTRRQKLLPEIAEEIALEVLLVETTERQTVLMHFLVAIHRLDIDSLRFQNLL